MTKCILCDSRPVPKGMRYCSICNSKLESESKRKNGNKPTKFVVYKEHVVGLIPNEGGTYTPTLLKRSADGLPKRRTLNLNTYLDGFTRQQIKTLKAKVLSVAHA